jgi:cobalt-zinc-cadmium efflux system membrane fusion protein
MVAFLRRLGSFLPSALAFLVLVVAAIAYQTGWQLPRFASVTGAPQSETEDWCKDHNVPESECVECNPKLLPKVADHGWCKKHGVHVCPIDFPDVVQVAGPPQMPKYDVLAALNLIERPTNNDKCKLHERRIQFASIEAVTKAGIDDYPVTERPMVEFVPASGEIAYDQTRVARLSSRAAGNVWRVDKEVGQFVKKGEVLALIDAAEVGRAKGDFLKAWAEAEARRTTVERMRPAVASGAVPERTAREAETALREAQLRLVTTQQTLINLGLPAKPDDLTGLSTEEAARRIQFLGLPSSGLPSLQPETASSNLLPITAPLDGFVIAREVVAGEVVDPMKSLFTVADTRHVWLMLHVRADARKQLALGQAVRFRPDGGVAEVSGKIGWLSTAVDEKTRTFTARADLANPDGRLLANSFGPGRIILREEPNAVVVPKGAVQWEGDCHVVFVRDKDYLREGGYKVFHVRTVRLGARDDKYVEILAGLLPGEVVVTKGSDVLRAELLKTDLGDG